VLYVLTGQSLLPYMPAASKLQSSQGQGIFLASRLVSAAFDTSIEGLTQTLLCPVFRPLPRLRNLLVS